MELNSKHNSKHSITKLTDHSQLHLHVKIA